MAKRKQATPLCASSVSVSRPDRTFFDSLDRKANPDDYRFETVRVKPYSNVSGILPQIKRRKGKKFVALKNNRRESRAAKAIREMCDESA